jgi:hypothetical protein
MRKSPLDVRLVSAACVCLLAPLAGCARSTLLNSTPRYRPGSEETTARLTRRIDPLVALFPAARTVPSQAFVDTLVDADARTELFRLESLLRLYRHKFSNLAAHLRQVKEVEDGLGAYAYAVDSSAFAKDKFKKDNQAQPPDAARRAEQEKVLEGLAKKEAAGRDVLTKLLEHSTLGADLPPLRSQVSSRFTGWGFAKDVPYVKRELQRMLSNVRDGRFDFTKLNDGIHEFRRQLRWFPITIDSLDGLILVRDDAAGACPVPALEALAESAAARHRYSNPALRFPSAHPCTISRCLLWQVVKTVRNMGHLKDEAEGNLAIDSALDDEVDVASSNDVTREETARAEAIRSELYESRALESLKSQLASCKP